MEQLTTWISPGGNMSMAMSIKKNKNSTKSVSSLTNKLLKENSSENEKWVYFAVAQRWYKLEDNLLR